MLFIALLTLQGSDEHCVTWTEHATFRDHRQAAANAGCWLAVHVGLACRASAVCAVQKDYFERSVNAAVGMHLAQSETVG